MIETRIPVTLLTGFLGAGKTTLLNRILTDQSAQRIAVIVNEFGEAGLDHDLIETASDDVVLMASGCLCCTVRGELADTMAQLIARRSAGEFMFDRVVIETTGLADPGPILQTMLVDRSLASATRMDGVVTVIDAANGAATLDAQFEAVSQVAMADLMVLSKTDLAAPETVIQLEERLRGINPNAALIHAVRGENTRNKIFDLGGMRDDVAPAQALSWLGNAAHPAPAALPFAPEQPSGPDPLGNLSGFGGAALPASNTGFNPHDSRIGSASIIIDEPLQDADFDRWLNTLISLRGDDILRVKGIVFLEGIEMPFVFHGVQQIFDPPRPVRDWPHDDRRSRIVVIARDLSRPELQRSFDLLRAPATAE